MKKINWFYKLMTIGVVILVLAACSGDSDSGSEASADSKGDGDKVVLTLANLNSEDHYGTDGLKKFKEVAEAESNGNIEVEIHHSGVLGSSEDSLFEMTQTGAVDLTFTSTLVIDNLTNVKGFNIFDVPFLFADIHEMYDLADSEYGDRIIEEFENNTNLKAFGFQDAAMFVIGNNSKPIESPDDLSGLKIRSSEAPLHVDALDAMGANPTPLAYGEVFTSLQQGTIDGMQTPAPNIAGDQMHEVLKHITLTKHVPNAVIVYMNRDTYEGLSEENRAAVDAAAAAQIEFTRQAALDAETEAVKLFKENGIEVIEPTAEQLEKFREAVQPAIDKNIDLVGQDNYEEALSILGK